jgi:hypothetical protein
MAPPPVGSASFALELDGKIAGWVQKFTGGAAHGDVVTEVGGHKHLGAVRYEDIVLAFGTGMSKAFYDWVAQGSDVDGGNMRKSGAVLTCDLQGRVQSRLEWFGGLITAVSFPTLDTTGKDQAAVTIKITPEYTRRRSGDGGQAGYQYKSQKAWLSRNFRLKIDGLEEACSRVSRVGPITVTAKVMSETVSDVRESSHEIGRRSLSDLIVTLPEGRAAKFYDWFENFVIKGNSGSDKEKNGSLQFLTPSLSSALFSLQFSGLGIYEMDEASNRPGGEIRNVTAKMYCEAIHFAATGAAS